MRAPMEWNVPPQSDGSSWPSKSATRRIISPAALLVNVSSRMRSGGNALFQQIGDAIGERARLARTRAGDDERRAGRRGDGGQLLRIQFARVINLQMDFGTERFENIIARHGAQLKGQTGEDERKISLEFKLQLATGGGRLSLVSKGWARRKASNDGDY